MVDIKDEGEDVDDDDSHKTERQREIEEEAANAEVRDDALAGVIDTGISNPKGEGLEVSGQGDDLTNTQERAILSLSEQPTNVLETASEVAVATEGAVATAQGIADNSDVKGIKENKEQDTGKGKGKGKEESEEKGNEEKKEKDKEEKDKEKEEKDKEKDKEEKEEEKIDLTSIEAVLKAGAKLFGKLFDIIEETIKGRGSESEKEKPTEDVKINTQEEDKKAELLKATVAKVTVMNQSAIPSPSNKDMGSATVVKDAMSAATVKDAMSAATDIARVSKGDKKAVGIKLNEISQTLSNMSKVSGNSGDGIEKHFFDLVSISKTKSSTVTENQEDQQSEAGILTNHSRRRKSKV